jgi:hypothetical protein
MGLRLCCAIAVIGSACSKSTQDSPLQGRGGRDREAPIASVDDDRFEGTISGHHFTISIAGGRVTASDRAAYTWSTGMAEVTLQDSGPIADETRYLVARSPRTIMRDHDGLRVVTEVVTTAAGRVFTCLYQQPVTSDGSFEAQQAKARGIAACTSLRVDP